MSRLLLFLISIIGLFEMATWSTGCANIIPPEGGPRDSIPPVLMKVSPPDSSRNFKGNRINFSFDEFVDVLSARENVFISPSPLKEPTVDFRLNTVSVKLNDALEPNTTYIINFGDAIRDYNEGNIYKNFTYIFSTGPFIDSLQLKGNVVLAENGKVDTTLIVILHTSANDSAVANDRPRYFTKLDGNGNFVFKNLPPKTFYLYALKDLNGTRRYIAQNLNSQFAFADKPVNPSINPQPVTLYAYAPVARSTSTGNTTPPGTLPSIKPNRQNIGAERLKYSTNLANNFLPLATQLVLNFDKPLKSFDSTQVRLYTDTNYTSLSGYHFVRDTGNKKVEVVYDWKENTSYHLVLEKDFAVDLSNNKLLKTDTIHFKTRKTADYGTLRIKFRNLDLTRHPVLLMYLGETLVRSVPLSSLDFSQALLFPGDYELRILYDENKNGAWDPGEFFGKRRQPEIVKPISRKVNVKANFENEFDVNASE
jgi:hypothetical protein